MRWVTATDLVSFANHRRSHELLPLLVRRLILATVPKVGALRMPAGDSIFRPGWDGVLVAQGAAYPVADGLSVWEFGADQDPVGKASGDLARRTRDPLGIEPSEAAFVFVTPRRWPDSSRHGSKDAWSAARTREGPWRAVTVLDADDLEPWLMQCPAVGAWFARTIENPHDGVEALEDFWWRHATDTLPALTPEVVLAGRDTLCAKLIEWAEGPSSCLSLKADTPEEAVLILTATAMRESGAAQEILLAEGLVVTDLEAWRQLTALSRPLVLIPLLRGEALGIGDAISRGHWIMQPLGWDQRDARDTLRAPWLDKQELARALEASGMEASEARKVARESGRSLQVLARRLSMNPAVQAPRWAEPEHAGALVSLLLAGRWKRSSEADRAVVSALAGRSFEDVERDLARWTEVPDAPVRIFDDLTTLTSPSDAWNQLGPRVAAADWERFEAVLTAVLRARDPSLDLPPDKRWFAAIYGKVFEHSAALRHGLTEQLVRVIAASERNAIPFVPKGMAGRIIREALTPAADAERWMSLGGLLPLLAEAEPEAMVDALYELLRHPDQACRLFEADNSLFGRQPHVPVMWAVERAAWFPSCVHDCASILVELHKLDDGGTHDPRPKSKFAAIFSLRRPETTLSFEDQIAVFRSLVERDPDGAWPLLQALLAGGGHVISSGLDYRDLPGAQDFPATWQVLYERYRQLAELLVDVATSRPDRWRDLLASLDRLPDAAREQVLAGLEDACSGTVVPSDEASALFRRIMEKVRRHRAFSDADWALPGDELVRLERCAERIRPASPVEPNLWLFDDWSPAFGRKDEAELSQLRVEALREILGQEGIEGVLELAGRSKHPHLVGLALAELDAPFEQKRGWLERLVTAATSAAKECGAAFVHRLARAEEEATVPAAFCAKWLPERMDAAAFGRLALGLPHRPEVWAMVAEQGEEAEREYWSAIGSYRGSDNQACEHAIYRLLAYGCIGTALHNVLYSGCSVQAGTIMEVLRAVPSYLATEAARSHLSDLRFGIEEAFRRLDALPGVHRVEIARLEWMLLPLLDEHGRGWSALQAHIRENPVEFVSLLRSVFYREDGAPEEAAVTGSNDEQAGHIGQQALQVLEGLGYVPGITEAGAPAEEALRVWVTTALSAAEAVSRRGKAALYLGDALARAPVTAESPWPPEHVARVLEEIWCEPVHQGFHRGALHKRGVHTVDGGRSEDRLASEYDGWSAVYRTRFRQVARALHEMAEVYRGEAKRYRRDDEVRQQLD